MKLLKLLASVVHGEGAIKVPPEWRELDPLTKADILKDWIYALESEYKSSLVEMKAQAIIRKAMIKNEQNTKSN